MRGQNSFEDDHYHDHSYKFYSILRVLLNVVPGVESPGGAGSTLSESRPLSYS